MGMPSADPAPLLRLQPFSFHLRTRTNQTETVFPFKTVYKWYFGGQVLWTHLEDQIELSGHNKVADKTLPRCQFKRGATGWL
jgi:hypothetical protein